MRKTTKAKSKKKYIVLIVLGVILLTGVFLAMLRIEKVTCEGNERLSDEELTARIFGESYDLNPIVFMIKSFFGDKVEIPFVEEYEIEMESLTSIRIMVYEKSIVGCLPYMGTYMYFDKDGIVVENSASAYEDIPEITGIEFENIILYEQIPVEDDKVFDLILDITQSVDKYDILVKKIHISDDMEVTLYINSFRVALGSGGRYGEKIAVLSDILPSMQDIPGELDMKEVNANGSGYVFKKE